jgi:predicted ATPase
VAVRLKNLTLRGFKTIRELSDFQPRPINILLGANGAGKSNFISFFRLMSWMMATPGELQRHVADNRGAHALLYDGPEVTREIEASLTLETEKGENDYSFRLFYAAGDTLLFADERYRFSRTGVPTRVPWRELGAGHREARLIEWAESGDVTARTVLSLLRRCIVHQFHNTSATARVRGKWNLHDSRWLKEDGANLAPFLLRLRDEAAPYYRRIVETLRLILPFFADFELVDTQGSVLLQWRERGSDMVFDVSQASDGMLRTMALVALLGQPEDDLPEVLVLDEPELGLHPYAIEVVAGMLRAASCHAQVLVATQSTAFVDRFDLDDILVVDRPDRESVFRRFSTEEYQEWLDEYAVSELWEKNVLGGRPGR